MSVSQSFQKLIERIQPSETQIERVFQHASTIKTRLNSSFKLVKLLIAGSYSRQTFIGNSSDVDLFVVFSRDEVKWGSGYKTSTTMLDLIRKNLEDRYTSTNIYKDVHAVVVEFSSSNCKVDVVPAIFWEIKSSLPVFQMPDGYGSWMPTSPDAHKKYILDSDKRSGGKLRRVAQLIKFWRECRSPGVPISSFHIEMMLAAGKTCEGIKTYSESLVHTFQLLAQRQCVAFRDPLGIAGNISATRSESQREAALNSVLYARDHAKAALSALNNGYEKEAKRQWDIVFNGNFPN